jgi:hypothetical protein
MTAESTTWLPARLIPTSGIKGAREQEMRATSALLSVLTAVDEFGKAIVRDKLGAPAGEIRTFLEVPLKLASGRTVRPDGAIVVTRGKRTWTALVEVKTARNELGTEQVEDYLAAARELGFDAVVTISNQLSRGHGEHPVQVDKRMTRRVQLHHLSWVAIVTEAVTQHEHREISDPDQAWILGELIAYLGHDSSGAMEFEDMGPHWTTIRDAARSRSLRARDEGVEDLLSRWDELSRYLSLHLGKQLGADVQQVLSRKERSDPRIRQAASLRSLIDDGVLDCTLRVPDVVSDIDIVADLRARTIAARLTVEAPGEGRPLTRINWLTRQLRAAPSDVRVDSAFEGSRQTTSELLGPLTEDGKLALLDDTKLVPKRFTIVLTREMGIKRGKGQGTFIESVTGLLETFYGEVAQEITPWTPKAPRLPDSHREHQLAPNADPEPKLEEREEHETPPTQPPPLSPPADSQWTAPAEFES